MSHRFGNVGTRSEHFVVYCCLRLRSTVYGGRWVVRAKVFHNMSCMFMRDNFHFCYRSSPWFCCRSVSSCIFFCPACVFWSELHLCTSPLAEVPEGGLYCSNTPTKPCSMKRGSLRRSLSLRVGTGNNNADQSQASAAAPNNNPQTTTTRQPTAGWRYDRELTARGGIHVNFGADLNRCVLASSSQQQWSEFYV